MYPTIKCLNWLIPINILVAIGCNFNAAVDGPPAGNPNGTCSVPQEAQAEDSSTPDHVVGLGTPESCTSEAFLTAVAAGGVITFNCGSAPVTITVEKSAAIFKRDFSRIVIDGGGKIALSGNGKVRILYLNVCDPAQGWLPADCSSGTAPDVTVQNLTFIDGNTDGQDGFGGGAIFVSSGGFLKIINCRFFQNACINGDWTIGGGAVRVEQLQPVYVVNSTFGGQDGLGNSGINGGAMAIMGGTVSVFNTVISYNQANGPTDSGTGMGGGIYFLNPGDLSLCGVQITNNKANGSGGAILFFASPGLLNVDNSSLYENQDSSDSPGYPGIWFRGQIMVQSSKIE